jgi:hypothetical protein
MPQLVQNWLPLLTVWQLGQTLAGDSSRGEKSKSGACGRALAGGSLVTTRVPPSEIPFGGVGST